MTEPSNLKQGDRTPNTRGLFLDVLARVLEQARKAESSKEHRAAFRSELQSLPSGSRDRLGALLNLGREAHDMAHVRTSMSSEPAVAPLDVLSLCDGHTLSQQYLERGFAAMCAANFDMDKQAPSTLKPELNHSVYERAWSRFGRELASSEPGDWSWFARYKGRSREIDKLYVRRGDNAWWSFAAGLDRPLRAQVNVELQRVKNARFGIQGPSLEGLASHHGARSRRALCRALSSVHARLGKVHV